MIRYERIKTQKNFELDTYRVDITGTWRSLRIIVTLYRDTSQVEFDVVRKDSKLIYADISTWLVIKNLLDLDAHIFDEEAYRLLMKVLGIKYYNHHTIEY